MFWSRVVLKCGKKLLLLGTVLHSLCAGCSSSQFQRPRGRDSLQPLGRIRWSSYLPAAPSRTPCWRRWKLPEWTVAMECSCRSSLSWRTAAPGEDPHWSRGKGWGGRSSKRNWPQPPIPFPLCCLGQRGGREVVCESMKLSLGKRGAGGGKMVF